MKQRLRPARPAAVLVALTISAACGGRTPDSRAPAPTPYEPAATAPSPPPPTNSAAADTSGWLEVDTATRTVALTLETSAPPGAPSALINGYRAGEVQVTLPVGWTVRWDWRSADSTASHSLVVMVEREKIPLEGGRPSFSNAMTRMVTEGLEAGQTDRTTFVAEDAGWYWLLCGVPGHAIQGEWISLKVDREAELPSVAVKGKA